MKLVALSKEYEESSSEKIKINYLNSVGLIFDDYLILTQHDNQKTIDLNTIKQFRLIKQKRVMYNLLCGVLGVALFGIYSIKGLSKIEILIQILLSTTLFVLAFKINTNRYILVLTQKNLNFIELRIQSFMKTDAKKLVTKVERELKKRNKMNIS